MKRDYSDIIYLPRPVSSSHKPMNRLDRAAQFAPFSALTGYKERILEEARLVVKKKELDTHQKELLDQTLDILLKHPDHTFKLRITYYVPDLKKEGGEYITINAKIKKINEYDQTIQLMDLTKIPICNVYSMEII